MKLIQTLQTQNKPKNATEHFKKCPACGETHLIQVKPEVLCSSCDWNSIVWSISRGSMDNLFSAAAEELKYERRERRKTLAAQHDDFNTTKVEFGTSEFGDAS